MYLDELKQEGCSIL